MNNIEQLTQRVEESYFRALDFFLEQTENGTEGWGPEPGDKACPWTTSQVLFSLGSQQGVPDEVLSRGINWLEKVQNPDGSWWSQAYGPIGDTPATSWATIVLVEQYGPNSPAAQRGIDWLCRNFRGGLTTIPTLTEERYLQCHLYSTATAIRALARAQRTPLTSLTIQEGIAHLNRARIKKQGWGYQADSPSDPTFTAYVLHGLFDVRRIRGVRIPTEDIREAVAWLLDVQGETGWWDWQGVQSSCEAAGYVLYVLLTSGFGISLEKLVKPVECLLDVQKPDGGWTLDPISGDVSNNWVTHSVLLGLKAFWLSYSAFSQQRNQIHAEPSPSWKPKDLDSGSLPGVSMMRWATHAAAERVFGWPTTTEKADAKALLYLRQIRDSWKALYLGPYDHTMFKALDRYVEDKLPVAELERILRESRGTIEIHGVYPEHFTGVAERLGFTDWIPIEFKRKPKTKLFNFVRPAFFRAMRPNNVPVIVISVPPGQDYCCHYMSMVLHYLYRLTSRAGELVQLYRYPDAERELVEWTGLKSGFVQRGDRVLLGYVDRVSPLLKRQSGIQPLGRRQNEFYASYRYRLPDGTVLNLIGVKYCFWGSIAEVLADGLCQMGCTEILYFGKLGALSKPDDVYTRVFSPSTFALLNRDYVVHKIRLSENPLLRMYPELDSGCHISVPTVLEEDYVQREVATELHAQSIDNEIAQIARAVNRHRYLYRRSVTFSPIHIATDYIRRPDERALEVPFDLGNEKLSQAKRRKREMVNYIIQKFLFPYLGITS